jgi:hypothetical protein
MVPCLLIVDVVDCLVFGVEATFEWDDARLLQRWPSELR